MVRVTAKLLSLTDTSAEMDTPTVILIQQLTPTPSPMMLATYQFRATSVFPHADTACSMLRFVG